MIDKNKVHAAVRRETLKMLRHVFAHIDGDVVLVQKPGLSNPAASFPMGWVCLTIGKKNKFDTHIHDAVAELTAYPVRDGIDDVQFVVIDDTHMEMRIRVNPEDEAIMYDTLFTALDDNAIKWLSTQLNTEVTR